MNIRQVQVQGSSSLYMNKQLCKCGLLKQFVYTAIWILYSLIHSKSKLSNQTSGLKPQKKQQQRSLDYVQIKNGLMVEVKRSLKL